MSHRADIKAGKLFRRLRADAPERVDGTVGHQRHPVGLGELEHPGGFREAGGDLGALFVVADAHRAGESGFRRDDAADGVGNLDGVGRHRDVCLVPAPYLDGMPQIAQQAHHLFRGGVVGGGVRGKKGGIRAPACGRAQRHAGMHPE